MKNLTKRELNIIKNLLSNRIAYLFTKGMKGGDDKILRELGTLSGKLDELIKAAPSELPEDIKR